MSLGILTLSWIVLDFATLSLVYLGFNRLSKSKVKNSDLEQKIKDLENKLEQVEGSD